MSARLLGPGAALWLALALPAMAGESTPPSAAGAPELALPAGPGTLEADLADNAGHVAAEAEPGTGTGTGTGTSNETETDPAVAAATPLPPGTRSGLDIYRSFREGLADPVCEPGASARWRQHFAHAPSQLATSSNDILPLFGYVVDRLREAHLPTEYALIPFVESGYRPGARSSQGPAGLWQFISLTARNHKVAVRPGYDGRLSPVDSTDAAVRYLKTLHGMFAGNWQLAVMAYNAGEYRLLGALRRAGQRPATADPASLPMPAITLAYVRKLHALSCVFEEAADQAWLQAMDRPVPILAAAEVPAHLATLDAVARDHGADAAQLRRLNPVFGDGRIARVGGRTRVLLPATQADSLVAAAAAPAAPSTVAMPAPHAAGEFPDAMADASAHVAAPRTHTVARGESAWAIARRHGLRVTDLLSRNGLDMRSVLRPGMVLLLDGDAGGARTGVMAE